MSKTDDQMKSASRRKQNDILTKMKNGAKRNLINYRKTLAENSWMTSFKSADWERVGQRRRAGPAGMSMLSRKSRYQSLAWAGPSQSPAGKCHYSSVTLVPEFTDALNHPKQYTQGCKIWASKVGGGGYIVPPKTEFVNSNIFLKCHLRLTAIQFEFLVLKSFFRLKLMSFSFV